MGGDQREIELIQRAVAGDEPALTALLTEARAPLREYLDRHIPACLGSVVDAEDFIQEACIEAFRHIRSFEPRGPDSFFRWLATIAIRRLRNAIKSRRAVRHGGNGRAIWAMTGTSADSVTTLLDQIAVSERTPSRSVMRREVVNAVESALADLPVDYRRAVWLVCIRGVSVATAALEMGRTASAVHNLCHKAKQRLRELLGTDSRFLSSRS